MELLITFLVAFVTTWFVSKVDFPSTIQSCPYKETVMEIAKSHHDKNILKEVKEYSLVQIQNGYYEYEEVLNELSKKAG